MKKQPPIKQIIQGMSCFTRPSQYWLLPSVYKFEFPELYDARSIILRNSQSVWFHTMSVIDLLGIKNPITLLSGLFHDLGKGCVEQIDSVLSVRFPNHAIESAKIAQKKLTEWEASPDIIDKVVRIVSTHMYDVKDVVEEKTIRKFVAKVGPGNIKNWFIVRIADSLSYTSRREYHSYMIKLFKTRVMSYLKKQPSESQPRIENLNTAENMRIEGGDA